MAAIYTNSPMMETRLNDSGIEVPTTSSFIKEFNHSLNSKKSPAKDQEDEEINSILNKVPSETDEHNFQKYREEYDNILEDIKKTVASFREGPSSQHSMLSVTPPISPPTPFADSSNTVADSSDSVADSLDREQEQQEILTAVQSIQPVSFKKPTPKPRGEPPSYLEAVARKLASISQPLKVECDLQVEQDISLHLAQAEENKKLFTNIPDIGKPHIALNYVCKIEVYPRHATGTLYERINGNVTSTFSLNDEQIFAILAANEEKGLSLIVRYISSTLMVMLIMHNQIFDYAIDFTLVPITVSMYNGKTYDYTWQ